MSTNGAPTEPPGSPPAPDVVRRLEGPSAAVLGDLVETFEELQSVLLCCERLVAELAPPRPADPVVVEGIWTMALLSYARCFAAGERDPVLTEADLTTAQPDTDVLKWHGVLLQLREQQADPVSSPREQFTIGVTQDEDGLASGVAITSARIPLVDDLTVRQTGAIAYALSSLVNERIEAQQLVVFEELKTATREDLEKLETVDLAPTSS